MSYVDSNLLPNERVIYRAHLHWAVYIPCSFLFVLGLYLFFAVGPIGQDQGGIHNVFGGIFVFMGIVLFPFAWRKMKTSEFAVTDKRVVIKVGLVRRRSLELLLRQVEGIGVDQGILGRIFGYGVITVGGTGGTKEPFRSISDPLEFRRQVQAQSTNESAAGTAEVTPGSEKICPRCAEPVKAAAKLCRFCNYEFA
jgi:uncharacterized membrane protein YdbT with pleckstrin-like domain